MSDADFEAYLALLGRFLRLTPRQRDEVRRELRAHLADAIEEEMQAGATYDQAVLRVLDDFGDAAELAARFSTLNRKRRWIMRGSLVAACLAGMLMLVNVLTPATTPPAVADAPEGAPRSSQSTLGDDPDYAEQYAAANAHIEAALAHVEDLKFVDAPLERFIEYLSDTFSINIAVYWQDLEFSGIERDTPISVDLCGLPMERTLRLALEMAGEDISLAYEVRDGVLVIATRERLERNQEARVYDISDLLAAAIAARQGIAVRTVSDIRRIAQAKATSEAAQIVLNPPQDLLRELSYMGLAVAAQEELLDLIRRTIRPDSWAEAGGTASITCFNGTLVILQTQRGHRMIAELLENLRLAGAGRVDEDLQ